MLISEFITKMPKVELHVHLEGAIQPATLLALAQKYQISLPASNPAELQAWYQFRDFSHFVEIYMKISSCIRTPEDIEFIAQEFLKAQAAQNILYSEVTYTAYTHYHFRGIPFDEQLDALNRARQWAETNYQTSMGLVIDIPRTISPTAGSMVADWAISAMNNGVVALGLGGPELGYPGENFVEAFEKAAEAGLASVPHAGETDGAQSIWAALQKLSAVRIGHGVRCLEDPALVSELRQRQIPLEVCPSSNICLQVAPNLSAHPLVKLLAEGLYVTINSDDPALFNTTLINEYQITTKMFQFTTEDLAGLVLNAAQASLLAPTAKQNLLNRVQADFAQLSTS